MIYLMHKEKPISILLIANNDNGIKDIWVEFNKVRLGNSVFATENSQQALDFLFHKGAYLDAKHAIPDLILISLKLSDTRAVDIFNQIKESKELAHIPIMFTDSTNGSKIVERISAENKIAYVSHPFTYSDFIRRLKKIGVRWTISKELPVLFFQNH